MVEGGRQRRLLVDTFRRLSRKEYTFAFHDQSRTSATSVRLASQTFNEHLAELPRAETITIYEKCSSATFLKLTIYYVYPRFHHGQPQPQHDRRNDGE